VSGRGECVCEGIGVSSMLRLIRRTGLSDEPRHPRCGQRSTFLFTSQKQGCPGSR
jgi:hypothetical protein